MAFTLADRIVKVEYVGLNKCAAAGWRNGDSSSRQAAASFTSLGELSNGRAVARSLRETRLPRQPSAPRAPRAIGRQRFCGGGWRSTTMHRRPGAPSRRVGHHPDEPGSAAQGPAGRACRQVRPRPVERVVGAQLAVGRAQHSARSSLQPKRLATSARANQLRERVAIVFAGDGREEAIGEAPGAN